MVLLIGGVWLATSLWRSVADHAVHQWAAANGFTLLEADRRMLLRGPFFFTSSNSQTVFRIRVRDAAGGIHSGWLRYGGWWLGALSGRIEVRWG